MQIIKKFILGVMFLATLSLSMTSCSEKQEVGEYDNWLARNAAYIDSIANVCNKNADGKWQKICAFNLNDSVESLSPNNQHYIYVHKLENGNGTTKPMFTDSVRVHYIGHLIPSASYSEGKVFDKSYSTYNLNELTDVPTLFGVGGVVVGFTTALLNMNVGDSWRVYIPAYLGYASKEGSSIPAYSTLVFDLKLAKIYKYKVDSDTSWH